MTAPLFISTPKEFLKGPGRGPGMSAQAARNAPFLWTIGVSMTLTLLGLLYLIL